VLFKEKQRTIRLLMSGIILAQIVCSFLLYIFLDVDMPFLNGFEFLKQLGEFPFEVIFTTAHSKYTLDALRVSAVDYLVKPVDQEELELAVERLRKRLSTRQSQNSTPTPRMPMIEARLPLPTQQGVYLIKVSEILRVEAMSNYSAFFLTNGKKIVVSKTLKEYDGQLPPEVFMRVNRSTILNLDFVVKYRKGEGGTLELIDGTEIEVSPQRKTELMSRIMLA
jgi:two-component system LytT family response regulator